MLDKEMLERLVNKVSDCIPEQFKQCKDDFSQQARSVIEKALEECRIVTQAQFERHLKTLERLQERVEKLEKRLQDLDKK